MLFRLAAPPANVPTARGGAHWEERSGFKGGQRPGLSAQGEQAPTSAPTEEGMEFCLWALLNVVQQLLLVALT